MSPGHWPGSLSVQVLELGRDGGKLVGMAGLRGDFPRRGPTQSLGYGPPSLMGCVTHRSSHGELASCPDAPQDHLCLIPYFPATASCINQSGIMKLKIMIMFSYGLNC